MICALRSSVCRFVRTGLLAKVLIFSTVFALIIILGTCMDNLSMFVFSRPRFIDNNFILLNCMKLVLMIPFASAVFCSVFTGNDVSSRTINNKIATGISRFSIYLADFIVSFFATALSVVIAFFVFYIFAKLVPVKENVEINIEVLKIAGSMILICASFTSLFLAFQYFFSNRFLAVIISVLIIPGLMVSASGIRYMLEEPYRYYVKTDEETETYEWRVNKAYVGGTPRKILTYFNDANPYGSMEDSIGVIEQIPEESLLQKNTAAGAVMILTTAAGLVSVKKKEYS